MKSLSLESVQSNLNKNILLAQSYTDCDTLEFIIKSCRLKPLEYLQKRNRNIVLYKHWIDEFGNSLKIVKNKKIKIIQNDLSIDRDVLTCTDLYYGLSLDKIVKISKLMYVCRHIDEDVQYTIGLLGIDNYIRAYSYENSKWEQISPLCLGLGSLKLIAKKADIQFFLKYNNVKNSPVPCMKANQWLTKLPMSNDLKIEFENNHPLIASLF